MSTQNRYIKALVGTANVNVAIVAGNTVALIAGSLCNRVTGPVSVNLWLQPVGGGANVYYTNNFPVPANSTITVFGHDQKHFFLSGDTLWINSNVASSLDFILSVVEGV